MGCIYVYILSDWCSTKTYCRLYQLSDGETEPFLLYVIGLNCKDSELLPLKSILYINLFLVRKLTSFWNIGVDAIGFEEIVNVANWPTWATKYALLPRHKKLVT